MTPGNAAYGVSRAKRSCAANLDGDIGWTRTMDSHTLALARCQRLSPTGNQNFSMNSCAKEQKEQCKIQIVISALLRSVKSNMVCPTAANTICCTVSYTHCLFFLNPVMSPAHRGTNWAGGPCKCSLRT